MPKKTGSTTKATTKQYTIRKIPTSVDQALKKRAKERGLSLNALIITLLKQEAYWLNSHFSRGSRKETRKTDCDWEHT